MGVKPEISKGLSRMKVGSQQGGITNENLEFWSRHGVYHVDGGAPKTIPGVGWDLEDSLAKKEACESYGISLESYHLPLSSIGYSTNSGIETSPFRHIMLGKSPERDREIELLQQMIMVAGQSGVHLCTYNTVILPILRTGVTKDPHRGNVSYNTWDYEEALRKKEPMIAGNISVDEIFERITYLLDRLLPVAEEYDVKLGNHIADPPIPASYRGVMRWNSPDVFEGIKRFAQLYDNEYHGFLFCVGSIAEGLYDPRSEIIPIIKWVGERNQIFCVHLRNIKGGFNRFMEVYPDNGDLDFLQVIKALKNVGYTGMVMPDHVPFHEDPNSELQAYAYAFGYIKALIHAAYLES